jgi:hypothetical protein
MTITQGDVQEKLRALLLQTTSTRKHSAYQILPTRLASFIGQHQALIKPKYEVERFTYITSNIDLKGKTALDIGSNTGYFTFELLDAGCTRVTAFEGGNVHCEFLQVAAKALGDEGRVSVRREYFDFHHRMTKHDIALLLNVVHHAGDDYGDSTDDMDYAKSLMLDQINRMVDYSDLLVFQMGFNWKGDISRCLFENGTKAEMIDFVSNGTKENWKIEHIGIAERRTSGITYANLNSTNVRRDDSLGEFLNRPIFIMSAK